MIYRAAVIGCGKIGSLFADDPKAPGISSHAGAYDAHERTRLSAVCGRTRENTERCAKRWGVDGYTDVQRMMDWVCPDIVSICTPDATHYKIAKTVLEDGGASCVIIEKPIAETPEQARELLRIAQEKDIQIIVNYSRRYTQCGHYAREHVRGCVEEMVLGFNDYKERIECIRPPSIGDKILSVTGICNGEVVHNVTHWIDLMRYLFGDPLLIRGVQRVSARRNSLDSPVNISDFDERRSATSQCVRIGENIYFGMGSVVLATTHKNLSGIHFTYENFDAFVRCGEFPASLFEMDIIGDKGRVSIYDSGHSIDVSGLDDSPHYTGYNSYIVKQHLTNCMMNSTYNMIDDAVHCLDTWDSPRCSGYDGLRALEIAHAAMYGYNPARGADE